MKATTKALAPAFSMIELVIVVAIVGIIAAIAVPKFADAGSGQRLSSAKRTLIADIQMAQLRARATSKPHVVKFYPSENRYLIVEGTDVKSEAVIHTKDFDDNPYNLEINYTSLAGDLVVVISAFGDLSPAFTVDLIDASTVITVDFAGVVDFGITPTITITEGEAAALNTMTEGVEIK